MLFVARESLISPLLAGRLDVDFMGWGRGFICRVNSRNRGTELLESNLMLSRSVTYVRMYLG